MTIEFYRVIHDPHHEIETGEYVHRERLIRQIIGAAPPQYDGLELSDGEQRYRIYQQRFYRIRPDGCMQLWPLRG